MTNMNMHIYYYPGPHQHILGTWTITTVPRGNGNKPSSNLVIRLNLHQGCGADSISISHPILLYIDQVTPTHHHSLLLTNIGYPPPQDSQLWSLYPIELNGSIETVARILNNNGTGVDTDRHVTLTRGTKDMLINCSVCVCVGWLVIYS